MKILIDNFLAAISAAWNMELSRNNLPILHRLTRESQVIKASTQRNCLRILHPRLPRQIKETEQGLAI
ncbi:MAG: hypothetical protein LUG99_02685 [Lachnospiraceae bacterium]|nr:hypothetical protein [Lachnospiraceae bacterium]